MKASVQNIDLRGIFKKTEKLKKDNAFGEFAAQTLAKQMMPYVPKREGILMNAKTKPWRVIYDEPYARKQYLDESLNHPQIDGEGLSAERGAKWGERYIREHKDDYVSMLQGYLDRK